MGVVVDYFNRFEEKDVTIPSRKAYLQISRTVDAAARPIFEDLIETLQSSNEHRDRVALLGNQNRTAGKFSASKVLFPDISEFEQMVAVNDWLSQKKIREDHTFFLSENGNDYVPVRAKKFANAEATLMHVILGATRGSHEAPKYTDWAKSDPRDDDAKKVFIAPLEMLEMVRQPSYLGATVLKGNAFESNQIDHAWRYGSTYACVEDKGQAKNSLKKQSSAGLNACALVNRLADASDPIAEEVNICPRFPFEEYLDTGYADHLELSVTPGKLMNAIETAIVEKKEKPLKNLMKRLIFSKMKVPHTNELRMRIAEKALKCAAEN